MTFGPIGEHSCRGISRYPVTVEGLLEHCRLYMNDAALKHDFKDCVLSLIAEGTSAHDKLLAYYRARLKAPNFSMLANHNNHRFIPEQVMDQILGRSAKQTRNCESCGRPFAAIRASARYCSNTCKQRAKRDREVVA